MTPPPAGDATGLLIDWSNGDERALDRLMPLVYEELRRLAAGYLRRERSGHTLQTTALVHEAYLRMIDQRRVQWKNSLHFVALSAQMMRRILIDHARSHRVAKRGGDAEKLPLEVIGEVAGGKHADVLEIDEALTELSRADADLGRIVELRFFGGLTNEEIADLLEISVPTITRRWRLAKAWLHRYISRGGSNGG